MRLWNLFLTGVSVFHIGENFHIAVETRRAAGEVLGDERIGLPGMFRQTDQFGIRRTIEAPLVGKGLGKISLSEVEKPFFVELSLHFFLH